MATSAPAVSSTSPVPEATPTTSTRAPLSRETFPSSALMLSLPTRSPPAVPVIFPAPPVRTFLKAVRMPPAAISMSPEAEVILCRSIGPPLERSIFPDPLARVDPSAIVRAPPALRVIAPESVWTPLPAARRMEPTPSEAAPPPPLKSASAAIATLPVPCVWTLALRKMSRPASSRRLLSTFITRSRFTVMSFTAWKKASANPRMLAMKMKVVPAAGASPKAMSGVPAALSGGGGRTVLLNIRKRGSTRMRPPRWPAAARATACPSSTTCAAESSTEPASPEAEPPLTSITAPSSNVTVPDCFGCSDATLTLPPLPSAPVAFASVRLPDFRATESFAVRVTSPAWPPSPAFAVTAPACSIRSAWMETVPPSGAPGVPSARIVPAWWSIPPSPAR